MNGSSLQGKQLWMHPKMQDFLNGSQLTGPRFLLCSLIFSWCLLSNYNLKMKVSGPISADQTILRSSSRLPCSQGYHRFRDCLLSKFCVLIDWSLRCTSLSKRLLITRQCSPHHLYFEIYTKMKAAVQTLFCLSYPRAPIRVPNFSNLLRMSWVEQVIMSWLWAAVRTKSLLKRSSKRLRRASGFA